MKGRISPLLSKIIHDRESYTIFNNAMLNWDRTKDLVINLPVGTVVMKALRPMTNKKKRNLFDILLGF